MALESLVITLQTTINLLFLAVVAVIYFSTIRQDNAKAKEDAIFDWMLLSTGAILLVDTINYAVEGRPGEAAHWIALVSNSLFFALTILPPSLFVFYTQAHLNISKPSVRQHYWGLSVLMAFWILLCLSNPWTEIIFRIDQENRYRRSWGFNYFAVVLYALISYSLVIVASHRRGCPRRQWLSLLFYPLPSIFGALGQQVFFGTILLWPGVVLSLLILAMNVQNERMGTDVLTGLSNRLSLHRYLGPKLRSRNSPAMAGIALDLDRFKEINDTLGHDVGDRALADAAKVIRQAIRKEDFAARLGGDEFLVLLETNDRGDVESVARRISESFERFGMDESRPYSLSASIGWEIYHPGKGPEPESFLKLLDEAMYRAKQK
ncbi:MAG: diguanylate cyclase [Spirochaetes bacterium]|nr:MAG: diguanylate cyclase [Spirochaetota bacterium]